MTIKNNFDGEIISINLLRAQRSEASLARELPVGVMGQKNNCVSQKTKHFWSMVHRRKNDCFYPLNPFP